MQNTGIRRAEPQDIAACAHVVATWVAETDWMPEEFPEEKLEEMIREAFPSREIWVSGDPVDCYMSVDPIEDKVGALYCLRTGEGVGKRLLDKAKEGRDFLWLTTHEPNLNAQRFYRREGFVLVEADPALAAETPPILRMEWQA